MTFDHGADDATVATGNLAGHIMTHIDLALVLFLAVGMAEVDHQIGSQTRFFHFPGSDIDTLRIVVRSAAATQDHVAVVVAPGREDRGMAGLGEGHEVVRALCCPDRIDRDLQPAIGAVLETDRAGKARGEFTVPLALGRPGTDRSPADEVGDVLRADQVEELCGRRQPETVEV